MSLCALGGRYRPNLLDTAIQQRNFSYITTIAQEQSLPQRIRFDTMR